MKQGTQIKTCGNVLINNVFSSTAVYYELTFQAFCKKFSCIYFKHNCADFMPA